MSEAPPYFPYDFAPPILSDLISSPTEKPTIPSDFSAEPGPSKSSALPDAETDDKDVKPTGPQRSTAGCLTCRRRKVKCDERRPVCAKCTIKHREVSQRRHARWTMLTSSAFGPILARQVRGVKVMRRNARRPLLWTASCPHLLSRSRTWRLLLAYLQSPRCR